MAKWAIDKAGPRGGLVELALADQRVIHLGVVELIELTEKTLCGRAMRHGEGMVIGDGRIGQAAVTCPFCLLEKSNG